jgi:ATP-dependent RNA helicase RhlE
MSFFSEFPKLFSDPVLDSITGMDILEPNELQRRIIPPFFKGRDLRVISELREGVSVFCHTVLFEKLSRSGKAEGRFPRAIILVSDLIRINEYLEEMDHYTSSLCDVVNVITLKPGDEETWIDSVDLLLTTPEMLLKTFKSNSIRFDRLEHLILDNVSSNMEIDSEKIAMTELFEVFKDYAKQSQRVLITQKLPKSIKKFSSSFLNNPEYIEVKGDVKSDLGEVVHEAYSVESHKKDALLAEVIRKRNLKRVLLYVNSIKRASSLFKKLSSNGIVVETYHSDKSQGNKDKSLARLNEGETRLIITTDLAQHGITVHNFSNIIHYELPKDVLGFAPRLDFISEADPAGQRGKSIVFLTKDDTKNFKVVERKLEMKVKRFNTDGMDL